MLWGRKWTTSSKLLPSITRAVFPGKQTPKVYIGRTEKNYLSIHPIHLGMRKFLSGRWAGTFSPLNYLLTLLF